MKPYSKDLRLRVLSAVDAGTPREEVAKTFSLGVGAHHKALAKEASRDGGRGAKSDPRQALQERDDARRVAAEAPGD
jgi:transposase